MKFYSNGWTDILVVMTTVTFVLRTTADTFLSWDPPVHALQVTLLSCDKDCRCTKACTHMSFENQSLRCELVQRSQANHSLYLDGRIGSIKTGNNGRPVSTSVDKESDGLCPYLDVPACPDLVTNGVTLVLKNLTKIARKRLIKFSWSPGYNDCRRLSECSNYDTRIVRSTMRMPCQRDRECVDAESECRDGQCWCKPGLSHDPDSLSCVPLCPLQYGSTFQIVKRYGISGYGLWTPVDSGNDIKTCMDHCLRYNGPERMCKYADFDIIDDCTLSLNDGGQSRLQGLYHIPIIGFYSHSTYLQRDCKSMMG